jgi:predicted HicB family RNase H-like nuclease
MAKAKQEPDQDFQGRKQVTVRLRPEDWRVVAHLAIDTNCSVNELILHGLNELLKVKKLPLIKI